MKAEKLLYSYLYNRELLSQLLAEYEKLSCDVHAQAYSDNKPQNVSDPVVSLTLKREKIYSQIMLYHKRVELVILFLNQLNSRQLDKFIIEMIYFCKVTMKELAKLTHMNERTLYLQRQKLIKEFCQLLQKNE